MSVIEFENVSKTYHLGAHRTSLRETVAQSTRTLFSLNGNRQDKQLFWALNDVSFEVKQGEVLGIIGPNGAGKSTILKLLSRVTFPTSGHIHTRGRMAALIELAAGFHPDLTGRENIYLNGSILGLKRREIEAQFASIVEFAELAKFIDTPVKRYSSGMYVRLAFAVAAHVRADLLLVDEVLSVGDMAFQQKCLTKMNELRDSGATIVFVSHNLWSVSTFCKRVILLQQGRIEAEGSPDEVIQTYRRREREILLSKARAAQKSKEPTETLEGDPGSESSETIIAGIELLNEAGQSQRMFDPNERITIRVHYVPHQQIETPVFVIRIQRADGFMCCQIQDNHHIDGIRSFEGPLTIEACIGPLLLVPDLYTIEVLIVHRSQPIEYASNSGASFEIKGNLLDYDYHGIFTPHADWNIKPASY